MEPLKKLKELENEIKVLNIQLLKFKQAEHDALVKIDSKLQSRMKPKREAELEAKTEAETKAKPEAKAKTKSHQHRQIPFPIGGHGEEIENIVFAQYPDFNIRSWLIFFHKTGLKLRLPNEGKLQNGHLEVQIKCGERFYSFWITCCRNEKEMLAVVPGSTQTFCLYAFDACFDSNLPEDERLAWIGMFHAPDNILPRHFYIPKIDSNCLHLLPSDSRICFFCEKEVPEDEDFQRQFEFIMRRELRLL